MPRIACSENSPVSGPPALLDQAPAASANPFAATELSATGPQPDTLLRDGDGTVGGRIMIVDDEPIHIKIVMKYLKDAGYRDFISTTDSRQALDTIRGKSPDVVLLDIMMPHVSGIDILEVMRSHLELSQLPVLMMTAGVEDTTKVYALELGATDFLTKPLKSTELIPRVKNALLLKSHHDQMLAYSRRLEHEVRQRTAELEQAREELVHVLACAAEYRDRETGNHVRRVGQYAAIIARQLGLSEVRVGLIEQGAVLHDVGKIGISDAVLHKPGSLDQSELAQIQRHCEYGWSILHAVPSEMGLDLTSQHPLGRQLRSPLLKTAAIIALSHHEKWDGSGYPQGLAGAAIPLEGRITAVADVFDALNTGRAYKPPIPPDRCFEILDEGRCRHFDPLVLDAFFAQIDAVLRVASRLADGNLGRLFAPADSKQ